MMRFYHLSYQQVLDLPQKVFWLLNRQIERIRAEETLALMPAMSAAMGGDGVRQVVEELQRLIGQPIVMETITAPPEDLNKLKAMFGG